MSDPTRWADGGGAPGELGTLLQSAREDVPSRQELAGVAAALAPLMTGSPGAASAGGGTAGGGVAGAASGAVSGPVVVLAVVAACALAGGGLYGLVKSSAPAFTEAPAQLEVPPPAAEVDVRGSAPSQQKQAPAVEVKSAEPVVLGPTAAAPAANAKPGPSEAELLRNAQRAVRSNPKRALELTQEHRRRFPNGALVQEREVIAIEALKALGDQKAASERAGDFEKSFPGSAHLPKVETLKQDPPGAP